MIVTRTPCCRELVSHFQACRHCLGDKDRPCSETYQSWCFQKRGNPNRKSLSCIAQFSKTDGRCSSSHPHISEWWLPRRPECPLSGIVLDDSKLLTSSSCAIIYQFYSVVLTGVTMSSLATVKLRSWLCSSFYNCRVRENLYWLRTYY